MRKTVTLTADADLYDAAKSMGISPSAVLDEALKAVIGTVGEDWKITLRERTLEVQIKQLKTQKETIQRQIEELKEKADALDGLIRHLEQQLAEIRLERRLQRLQTLIARLRTVAETFGYDVEAMESDPDVSKLIEEIKDIRPDFDLRKYVELWKTLGGGV